LADLTIPINNQGQYVDDGKGISDPNLREKDFAI
jgi:hypothetical protein